MRIQAQPEGANKFECAFSSGNTVATKDENRGKPGPDYAKASPASKPDPSKTKTAGSSDPAASNFDPPM
jgi:hypothetical protein